MKANQKTSLIFKFFFTITAFAVIMTSTFASKNMAQKIDSFFMWLAPIANATDLFVESSGVGIGVQVPERQLHLRGNNAVFRMDRNVDGASFLLVRTDSNWKAIKTFQVGVIASGANNGAFIINDLGQNVAGYGINRMMITNSGETHFSGIVKAQSFSQTSSANNKENIVNLTDAEHSIRALRGVRFTWKESGKPGIGLIAEEVAQVYPELVTFENESPTGVNYSALVAVLIEALKAQQKQIAEQKTQLEALTDKVEKLAEKF